MSSDEIVEKIADRLPRALAAAAGVKWWSLGSLERAELAQDASALLIECTVAGIVVLPVEVFGGEIGIASDIVRARKGARPATVEPAI